MCLVLSVCECVSLNTHLLDVNSTEASLGHGLVLLAVGGGGWGGHGWGGHGWVEHVAGIDGGGAAAAEVFLGGRFGGGVHEGGGGVGAAVGGEGLGGDAVGDYGVGAGDSDGGAAAACFFGPGAVGGALGRALGKAMGKVVRSSARILTSRSSGVQDFIQCTVGRAQLSVGGQVDGVPDIAAV